MRRDARTRAAHRRSNERRASSPGVRALVGLVGLLAGVGACGSSSSPAHPADEPLPPPPEPYARPEYQALSETGAYADLGAKTLARGFEAFRSADGYELPGLCHNAVAS